MIWVYVSSVLIILYIIFFIYSLVEKYLVKTKTYQINIKKDEFNGFKIIFLTDFHYSEFVSLRFIRKIVKRVNEMNPDLILLGGDYISTRKRHIEPVFKELKLLKAKFGVYGVLGNHDVDVSKEIVLEHLEKAGILSLDNKAYWIKKGVERIKIGGVSDCLLDKPDITSTLNEVTKDDFVILVSHNPDYVEDIKDLPIDLMLSGHTHGGQVTIFGLYAPYIPSKYKQKYRTGLKIVNKIKLIISNGIGVIGLPIRFFAWPQIVVVELINMGGKNN